MIIPQTPWYQNPVALLGAAGQAAGYLVALSSFLVTVPGLPKWVQLAAGGVLALASYYGYQAHSANVRAAELATAATTTAAHLAASAATTAAPAALPLPTVDPASLFSAPPAPPAPPPTLP